MKEIVQKPKKDSVTLASLKENTPERQNSKKPPVLPGLLITAFLQQTQRKMKELFYQESRFAKRSLVTFDGWIVSAVSALVDGVACPRTHRQAEFSE